MNDTETSDAEVRAIAQEAVTLIDRRMVSPSKAAATSKVVAGAALARLGRLLGTQLNAAEADYEVLALCARAAMETWLTGHAALVLGDAAARILDERAQLLAGHMRPSPEPISAERGEDVHASLGDIARLLDDTMYGESERPKAFRRHLASFFDEIDVAGAEGTSSWLARYIDDAEVPRVRTSPTPTDRPTDFVRVGLWITLFLAHDYFAAVGERSTAQAARTMYDRLRRATDDFYSRRSDAMRSG